MNALEVLRDMHVEAKSAFQQIEQAAPDSRGGLWAKLRPELVLHEMLEERFVYDPVARDAEGRDSSLVEWDRQHKEQVHEAETMIDRIGGLDPRDNAWLQAVTQLRMTLEQHIEMEEGQIWPSIAQFWGADKLEQVGGQLQAAKTAGAAAANATGAVGQVAEAIKNAFDSRERAA